MVFFDQFHNEQYQSALRVRDTRRLLFLSPFFYNKSFSFIDFILDHRGVEAFTVTRKRSRRKGECSATCVA